MRTPGGGQSIRMVRRAMPTTAKYNDRHAGRDGCLYADSAVFDDDAVLAPSTEPAARDRPGADRGR